MRRPGSKAEKANINPTLITELCRGFLDFFGIGLACCVYVLLWEEVVRNCTVCSTENDFPLALFSGNNAVLLSERVFTEHQRKQHILEHFMGLENRPTGFFLVL